MLCPVPSRPPAAREAATVPPAAAGLAGARERRAVEMERAENFPVALRLLPRVLRVDLRAVYDVVRLIDDVGDEAAGDRTAQLTALADELAGLWQGRPVHTPALVRLVPTVRSRHLPEEPFQRLVAANLQDQRVAGYEDRAQLLAYCALSAEPIGRLVLALFGVPADEAVLAASDRVCTALQLLEHWQDVGEDRRRGRVYLPQDAMRAAGVGEADLDAAEAGPALRGLVLAQTELAAELLASGSWLVSRLHGWARLAVAGYVAGGRATADALRRSGGDVLAATPRPRRRDLLRHLVPTLAGALIRRSAR
jgi:squalene synthase HpnC